MDSLRVALFFLGCIHTLTVARANTQDTITISGLEKHIVTWQSGRGSFLQSDSGSPEKVLASSYWQTVGSKISGIEKGYYWLRFFIKNDQPDTAYADFAGIGADSILLFTIQDSTPLLRQVTGNYVTPQNWIFQEYPELSYLRCIPGETSEVLIRLSKSRTGIFRPDRFRIQSRSFTLKEIVEGYRIFTPRVEFNGFFLGAVCVMMLFFFFLYIRINEKALHFYALYLLGAACYALLVKTLPYSHLARIAYLDYELTYKLGEPVQYFFFASYAWFARHLLDIDSRHRRLYSFIRILTTSLLLAGSLLLLVNLTNFSYLLQEKVYVLIRLLLLPIAVLLVIWISIVIKNPVKWFFITGSSFFITGGLIAFLVDPKSRHLFFGNININPVVSFKTGILLESISFALALGYKLRLIREEKEKADKALVRQAELNRQLIATENERLEKMVTLRTHEIVEKNALLEDQRQKQLKSEFEKQLAEMEMQALRSQMNPHFIFNSLNSIRHQILTKKYSNASDYLMRFARLLRQILQNSREHVIPLSEETDLIELYLQLEQLRFGDRFEYHLDVDPELDTESILIPSLLLQPYVENALKHGIANSSRLPRRIDIRILETEEGLLYEIQDNGIGRLAASLRQTSGEKPGLGLKITSERIALFNTNYHQSISVTFEDLFDSQNQASGTKVIIKHISNPAVIT